MQYTVGAAARATGVSESRLRTWERRYGIPAPGRSATGRRLYDEADLLLIQRMASLVDAGIPAAQAAEAVHAEAGEQPALHEVPAPEEEHPLVAQLLSAAASFDVGTARGALQQAVSDLGWREALEAVIFPALLGTGVAWDRGELTVANEHFLSELVRLEIMHGIAAVPEPASAQPLVLLACPEYEHHDLGLVALWLLLSQEDVRVRFLGANLPEEALVDASRELGPAAVALASTVAASAPALGQAARAVLRTRPAPRVFVGGPGLRGQPPGALGGVRLPERVTEAATAIVAAV